MAKTQLTRDIEAALHAWHPSSYGGYRVDSFRQGLDALRSAGRMRVCQIRIGRFRQGSGMLYLRNQIWDLQTGLAYRNGYGCFACRDSAKSKRGNLRQEYFIAGFCREHCSEQWCHFHKTNHLYTLDAVITCVEIKISVSDFHSAHGHNFVGHCNYYAMPTELYKKVKGEIPEEIGVLLYYDGMSTCGIRKAKECKPQILSESTQKWLILSVAKRLLRFDKN